MPILAQLLLIALLSRAMGALFVKLRQPQVIGEIVAGVILGPTLFGWVWPQASAAIFPADSLKLLNNIAQIGVLLFLFLIGLEFNPGVVRQQGRRAAAISLCGIAAPFALGAGLTLLALGSFLPTHRETAGVLFIGAAMSVTAFPVLARIVAERNLHRTQMGMLAVASAAVDDVLAWTMLAVVVALVPNTGEGPWTPVFRITFAGLFVAFMVFVARPLLKRLAVVHERRGGVTPTVMSVAIATMLAGALTTELCGVHALFGAFVAGFVMPKNEKFVLDLWARIESLTLTLLLPAFFAYAGLRADLRQVFSFDTLVYTVLVIVIACVGKVFGCGLAARFTGLNVRDSLAVGLLMNTRGLMELIILSTGLEMGVIDQRLYGMMVVMALVTTAATAPLLSLVLPREVDRRQSDSVFSVLLPVAKPASGGPLVALANSLVGGSSVVGRIIALYLSPIRDASIHQLFTGEVLQPAKLRVLDPLLSEASRLGAQVDPMAYFSRDVPSDVGRVVRRENVDLVLLGARSTAEGGGSLGKVVHRVMAGVDCDAAVYIHRGDEAPRHLAVPYSDTPHDRLAVELARRIAATHQCRLTIFAGGTARPPVAAGTSSDGRSFDESVETCEPGTLADRMTDASIDLLVLGVAVEWSAAALLAPDRSNLVNVHPYSVLVVQKYIS